MTFYHSFFIALLFFSPLAAQTVITIDNTQCYQTIDGWEAVVSPLATDFVRDNLLPNADNLIDLAVNDLGITRLRLGLQSGIENPTDYFQQLVDGTITYDDYKLVRYTKFNDNDDPFVFDPNGFQLDGTDCRIENIVLPFKQAVEMNNERFYLNVCFVDFEDQSTFHHTSDAEEYAEFIAYVWTHIYNEHNLIPDGLEIILEPDLADVWDQTHLAPSIIAACNRLKHMGFNPEVIAPSVTSLPNTPIYFNAIAANPEALGFLDVISYHRYIGNSNYAVQQQIVDLAAANNLKTGMLEYAHNGDVNELHYDLKHNYNTAWTKFGLMYPGNEKWAYVYVDNTDPLNPTYGVCDQTKYLRQYFKFIRPDATRIDALGGSSDIDPVAFQNSNGNQVVVIKAKVSDNITINGLKAGEYGIKYTLGNYDWADGSPNTYDFDLPNQTILTGEAVSFTMPAKGVVTVYGISPPVITSPTNLHLDRERIDVETCPTDGYFSVSGLTCDYVIEILDANENLVQTITGIGTIHIDLSTIPNGLHFIRAEHLVTPALSVQQILKE